MAVTKVLPLVVALKLLAFCYPSRSVRRLDSLHQWGTLPRVSLHDEDECLDMDFFLLDWTIERFTSSWEGLKVSCFINFDLGSCQFSKWHLSSPQEEALPFFIKFDQQKVLPLLFFFG